MSSLDTLDSVVLVCRAKEGDREALGVLYSRYRSRWMRRFHGKLGPDLRRLYETQDVIQSAMTRVLSDVKNLRYETAFDAWVSAIIQRKIADKARRNGNRKAIPLEVFGDVGKSDHSLKMSVETMEDYIQLLDAILVLFPEHPDKMGALYLRYFEGAEMEQLMEGFGKSRRSIYRLMDLGVGLLRSRMGDI